jgi:hypothetical protein
MAEIDLTLDDDGRAYISLGGAEIRTSVALDGIEGAEGVPALDALVLHFDHYGRLAGIEVTDSAASVLPPALLDAAENE